MLFALQMKGSCKQARVWLIVLLAAVVLCGSATGRTGSSVDPEVRIAGELYTLAMQRGVVVPPVVAAASKVAGYTKQTDHRAMDWVQISYLCCSASASGRCLDKSIQWAAIVLVAANLQPSALYALVQAGCPPVSPSVATAGTSSGAINGNIFEFGMPSSCWPGLLGGAGDSSTMGRAGTTAAEDASGQPLALPYLARGLACELAGGGGVLHAILRAAPPLQLSIIKRLLSPAPSKETALANQAWISQQCTALPEILPRAAAQSIRRACASLRLPAHLQASQAGEGQGAASVSSQHAERREAFLRTKSALARTFHAAAAGATADLVVGTQTGDVTLPLLRAPGLAGRPTRNRRRAASKYVADRDPRSPGPQGNMLPWYIASELANGATAAAVRIVLAATAQSTRAAGDGAGGSSQDSSNDGSAAVVDSLIADQSVMKPSNSAALSAPWCGNALHLAARSGNRAAVAMLAMGGTQSGAARAASELDCVRRTPAQAAAASGDSVLAGQLLQLAGESQGDWSDPVPRSAHIADLDSSPKRSGVATSSSTLERRIGIALEPLVLAYQLQLEGFQAPSNGSASSYASIMAADHPFETAFPCSAVAIDGSPWLSPAEHESVAKRVVSALAHGMPVLVRGGARITAAVASRAAVKGHEGATTGNAVDCVRGALFFDHTVLDVGRMSALLDGASQSYAVGTVPYAADQPRVEAAEPASGSPAAAMTMGQFMRDHTPSLLQPDALRTEGDSNADGSWSRLLVGPVKHYVSEHEQQYREQQQAHCVGTGAGSSCLNTTSAKAASALLYPPMYLFDHTRTRRAHGVSHDAGDKHLKHREDTVPVLSRVVPHPLPCISAAVSNITQDHGINTNEPGEQQSSTKFTETAQSRPYLAVGPAGSGAPPHTHKHAANALLRGAKLWWVAPPAMGLYSSMPSVDFFTCALPCGTGLHHWTSRDGRVSPEQLLRLCKFCPHDSADTLSVPGCYPGDLMQATGGGNENTSVVGSASSGSKTAHAHSTEYSSTQKCDARQLARALAKHVLMHPGVVAVACAFGHHGGSAAGGPTAETATLRMPMAGVCLQRDGDVMIVPHGSSHAVLNLDDSIAVAHEFGSVLGPLG